MWIGCIPHWARRPIAGGGDAGNIIEGEQHLALPNCGWPPGESIWVLDHGSRAAIPRSRRVRHPCGQDEADLARDLHDSRRVRHLDHDDEQAPIPFDVRNGSDWRDDDRHDCIACACDEHPRESWIR